MSSKNKNFAKDWAEKAANSNGTMVQVPSAMNAKTEDFQKKSDEYLAKAREFDKLSAEFDVYAKNFWHEMRKALEEAGTEEIWGKNIGFNEQARKDGVKIINIMPGGQGGMPMR